MTATRWDVTEYRGPEALAALEPDWARLRGEMPHPAFWHSHEAYTSYVAHLCPAPQEFRCFALSDGTRIRAILPLEERYERGRVGSGIGLPLRVWGMPLRSGWNVNDAIGPMDDARAALLPAVVAHLRRDPARPAVLDLGRSREASGLWEGLDGLGSVTRFAFTDREEFVFPTDMPIGEFMSRLSKNARTIVKRAARRFEAMDGARYVRARTPEELATAYEDFLAVEGSGWKGAQGSAIRSFPDLVAFYADLTHRLASDGHCEIHTLHVDGRCIAAGFWIYSGNEAALLKLGYEEEYARISPGRLMTQKALEYFCEDPAIDVVSIMSNAPWAVHWVPLTNAWRRAFISLRPVTGTATVTALRLWYGPLRRSVRRVRAWRLEHAGSGKGPGREAVELTSPKQ